VYRRMDIGTDKPTQDERSRVPHHLIDIVNPGERFTVADFTTTCQKLVEVIKGKGRFPIIVGGTCMYLHALREGYNFCGADGDASLRRQLAVELKEKGSVAMHTRLHRIDPAAADKIHPNDEYRILRALEIYHITSAPPSKLRNQEKKTSKPLFRYLTTALFLPRKILYEKINKRVDKIYNIGLINETEEIMRNFPEVRDWLSGVIGYSQAKDLIEGKKSNEEAIDGTKKETRHFARRQLIWFRRLRDIVWIYADGKTGADLLCEIRSAAHY
ncbi:MAG: tRNA (adenosine(37)-N6)-dimethylallyltransferase MiaA, partial [bacterium]